MQSFGFCRKRINYFKNKCIQAENTLYKRKDAKKDGRRCGLIIKIGVDALVFAQPLF